MADSDKQDSVVVDITEDNRIFLGADSTALDALALKMEVRVSASSEKKVYAKADGRAQRGNAVEVFDDLPHSRRGRTRPSVTATQFRTDFEENRLNVLLAERPTPGQRTIVVQVLKSVSPPIAGQDQ